jgi:hypothetical protein
MQMLGEQAQYLHEPDLVNPLLEAPMAGLVRRILGRYQPIARRCPVSKVRRSALPACRAMNAHRCPRAAKVARTALQVPTVHLSFPNGLPSKSAETP